MICDGSMNIFVIYFEEGGLYFVVFFYMDVLGKWEELYDMVRCFGIVGYFVVLLNLYYCSTWEFDYI